jgi:hypothetical protein
MNMADPIDELPTPPSRSDAPATFISKANAFIAALVNFVLQLNVVARAFNFNATNSTSTTSLSIGTGAKSLTVDASKSYLPGQTVKIARTSDGTKWMLGDVTSYNSTTGALAVTVSKVQGSGTFTDWTITLAATDQFTDDSVTASKLADSALGFTLINGTLERSVTGNALTISIKTKAGADPSANDPVLVSFRNATAGVGDYTILSITAATSITVSSGSTLGTSNNVPFKLWVVGFNDAGTFRLGVINTVSGTNIYPLYPDTVASSTAEGGAGAADSAHVFYTGTAVTSKAYVPLGYLEWTSGLATAGTWSAVSTNTVPFHAGIRLPGEVVQVVRNQTGAVATGTTSTPLDDTIPQQSEMDIYMSQAITPRLASNLLRISAKAFGATSTAGSPSRIPFAFFQDAISNALAVGIASVPGAANQCIQALEHQMLAGTTNATTFKFGSSDGGGTWTFNGDASARYFGGTLASYIQVEEIQT